MGLRGQIILALSLVFALSFALLGIAAVEISRRADRDARVALQETLAHAIAAHHMHDDHMQHVEQLFTRMGHRALGSAVSIERDDHVVWSRGRMPSNGAGASRVRGVHGEQIAVWLPPRDATPPPVARLLLFYVLLTGAGVLLMTYVALTNLIVRPLGRLTASAERLASGVPHVRVDEQRGALEVRRLAGAFNEMSSQLRHERASLELRLNELETATTELRFTQRQLVHGEKLASVGRLAAGVAHEIGNPLSAVLGFVELLQGEGLTPSEQAEFLARIHKETNRIHHIIRELLDFARQGGEPDRLDVTSDVRAAIDDAVSLVRPQKELRAVEITVDVPPLPRVLGAQHRLTQVMLNLLLNAADAMAGQGAIVIEGRAIDGTDHIELTITDSGPGIAPEIMDRLFEPFTTTKPVGAGTGLGLAVSHTLIEGMGGTIRADNPPQGGARFTITLLKPRASMRPPAMPSA